MKVLFTSAFVHLHLPVSFLIHNDREPHTRAQAVLGQVASIMTGEAGDQCLLGA